MIGGVRGGEGVEEGGRGEWLPWEQEEEWGWGWGWEVEGWEEEGWEEEGWGEEEWGWVNR